MPLIAAAFLACYAPPTIAAAAAASYQPPGIYECECPITYYEIPGENGAPSAYYTELYSALCFDSTGEPDNCEYADSYVVEDKIEEVCPDGCIEEWPAPVTATAKADGDGAGGDAAAEPELKPEAVEKRVRNSDPYRVVGPRDWKESIKTTDQWTIEDATAAYVTTPDFVKGEAITRGRTLILVKLHFVPQGDNKKPAFYSRIGFEADRNNPNVPESAPALARRNNTVLRRRAVNGPAETSDYSYDVVYRGNVYLVRSQNVLRPEGAQVKPSDRREN
ncbi:hypothetical protein [Alienimonas chondri]|uniref:Uncharacterized protein n=1 Tax=Alienimonas chondri TaxID=2681879 RepID=A0ABX1VKK4_9PLAN|nr:hypothetical protein [Alienimonas chondri]NNJ27241.1 hypothetical protein [Alienimonas chondri]